MVAGKNMSSSSEEVMVVVNYMRINAGRVTVVVNNRSSSLGGVTVVINNRSSNAERVMVAVSYMKSSAEVTMVVVNNAGGAMVVATFSIKSKVKTLPTPFSWARYLQTIFFSHLIQYPFNICLFALKNIATGKILGHLTYVPP